MRYERTRAAIRWALLLVILTAAAPVLALMLLYTFVTIGNVAGGVGFHAESLLLVLLQGCCAAIGWLSVCRMRGRFVPVWLWIGLSAAEAILGAVMLILANESIEYGMCSIPLIASSAMLALNGLWTLLERRSDAAFG